MYNQPHPAVPAVAARWDPAVYAIHADHRSRPFFDLIGRIRASAPRSVVDLGCGSGELTAALADRWPEATVLGIDNSQEMLAAAKTHAGERVSFAAGDLTSYLPDPSTEVVVSNAAYQWVPGHERILAEIARQLPAGGALAVQVPGNFDAPSHRAIRSLVAQPRWQEATGGLRLRTEPVLTPEQYAALLITAGLTADVWETTYQQVLAGDDPVLSWVTGTALRPVLAALDSSLHDEFLDELGARLREAYPPIVGGSESLTLFGFRRIFLVGHRP